MQTMRTAHSKLEDTADAARDFYDQLAQHHMALVLFFCSSYYDLAELARAINALFGSVPVIGCTTAGEIGPGGYEEHSISGVSFPANSFVTATALFGPLQDLEIGQVQQTAYALKRELDETAGTRQAVADFAFLMVDGLSQREEPIIGALNNCLNGIPIVGGSAGDDLQFQNTYVFHEGRFFSDHAVLVLVRSDCPVTTLRSQHFNATDERMVITAAEPEERRVTGINGLPAAEEYARLIGVGVAELGHENFAFSPVVVLINGQEYVRSIQKVNADGSLTFLCAIEEGVVIRLAKGSNLIENLATDLGATREQIGEPQAILGCDCVLRKLEITGAGTRSSVEATMESHRVVGFSSYGEQYRGVHVNQTFTALAIGHPGGLVE